MANTLWHLLVKKISLVPRGANQLAAVCLYKSDTPQEERMADKDVATQLADLQAQVATLTKAKADADAAIAKAEVDKQAELKKADDLKKSAEQKAADTSEALVTIQKQLQTAQEQVSALSEEREAEKYATIAKSVPHLGADAGKQLRVIAKALGVEGFQEYLAHQKRVAAELAGSKLLKEIGTDGTGDIDPTVIVEKIAKTLKEKDPTLTDEQAMVRAFHTDAGKAAFGRGGND